MVGGGFYEPILISIPAADQRVQIIRLADYLEQHFGERPTGAWLAERVWEPQLASVLAEGNVGYTLLDDIHFLSAGFEPDELFATRAPSRFLPRRASGPRAARRGSS